jgi:mRNA interferase MazF
MPHFIKNFVDWFALKPRIEEIDHLPPLVKERDLWWCRLGENIGTEVSGKGQKFTRPVIIFKKLSKYTFFVIPCSTQIKTGSWFVPLTHKGKNIVACLHQAKVVDYRRLDDTMGALSNHDYKTVKQAFKSLYVGE